MSTPWNRMAERPLGANMIAGILFAGIVSLMASPNILDHGKTAVTSPSKSASPHMGSVEAPKSDCSSSRHHTSDPLP